MNYYNEIKEKLIDNEIYSKVKDYSKEKHKVITYFEIGKLLNEAGGKYGDNIINEYSKKLVIEVGKKYNIRTLFRMRQFYNIFNSEKVSTLWTQITWSHIRLLFSLDFNAINYYISIIVNNNISVRELEYRIKCNEYERLPRDIQNKLLNKEELLVTDFVKNPIILKDTNNYEIMSEKVLKKLILENISLFLKELGEGFTFIDDEYKIKLGDRYNYIDLLLYNIKFKCYVVIELKSTELNANHIGQIQKYVNYIDKNIKTIEENKTVGIIICKKDNQYVIEYCSDKRIIAREYNIMV